MQQSLKGDDMNIIATRTKSPDTPPPPPSSPPLSPPLQALNNNRFRC